MLSANSSFIFFFFNDTATTEIYTLSLHDALPISNKKPITPKWVFKVKRHTDGSIDKFKARFVARGDRKSTRLNSSHSQISYAVFCLKKKKKNRIHCNIDF